MGSKLGISIPNHTTTLAAAIERLKKKSLRRKGKTSRNSPDVDKLKSSSSPSSPSLDDIPSVDRQSKRGSAMLPSYAIPSKHSKLQKSRLSDSNVMLKVTLEQKAKAKVKGASSKSLNYAQMFNDDDVDLWNGHDDDTKIDPNDAYGNTEALKKELTESTANKKHRHKDIGKKLWPKETSNIVKAGWMKKRGVRATGFKQRWCVLRDNGHMYYFEKRPASNGDLPQGMLDLALVAKVEYVEDAEPNTFQLKTQDRDWIFSAMSGGQLVEWMSALNKTKGSVQK